MPSVWGILCTLWVPLHEQKITIVFFFCVCATILFSAARSFLLPRGIFPLGLVWQTSLQALPPWTGITDPAHCGQHWWRYSLQLLSLLRWITLSKQSRVQCLLEVPTCHCKKKRGGSHMPWVRVVWMELRWARTYTPCQTFYVENYPLSPCYYLVLVLQHLPSLRR